MSVKYQAKGYVSEIDGHDSIAEAVVEEAGDDLRAERTSESRDVVEEEKRRCCRHVTAARLGKHVLYFVCLPVGISTIRQKDRGDTARRTSAQSTRSCSSDGIPLMPILRPISQKKVNQACSSRGVRDRHSYLDAQTCGSRMNVERVTWRDKG